MDKGSSWVTLDNGPRPNDLIFQPETEMPMWV